MIESLQYASELLWYAGKCIVLICFIAFILGMTGLLLREIWRIFSHED